VTNTPKARKIAVLFFSILLGLKKCTGKFLSQLFVYKVTLELREEKN